MKILTDPSRRLLACVAVLGCFAVTAGAADRKFPVPNGSLVVDVDANWASAGDMPADAGMAVGFKVGDGSSMRWLFAPATDAPAGAGNRASMRDQTMALKEELARQNAQMPAGLIDLDGPRAKGYYVDATDPKPKPGEHEFMYTGWVAVDGLPVMFNIVFNRGGERAAKRALESVKSMRVEKR